MILNSEVVIQQTTTVFSKVSILKSFVYYIKESQFNAE